jgi:imidazole glycerol-phosphate synthase subunit HisF
MLATRLIPCLDVDDGRVVKGVKFQGLRDAGDPVELARRYNDEGADELTFLDIGATYKSRQTLVEVVRAVARQVFIPLCVGGGIRSEDDMRAMLNAGADKVAVTSAAVADPKVITRGALAFGSQCVVLSIDAKRAGPGHWTAYIKGGREDTGLDVLEWAKLGEANGAGEILLNSIDSDGMKTGFDLELTKAVSESVGIPVIASGGAGNPDQVAEAVTLGKADAVLVASIVHFGEYTISQIKRTMESRGVTVRW